MWVRWRARRWWEELHGKFWIMCKRLIGGRTGKVSRWCVTWEVETGWSIRWEKCCTKRAAGSAIRGFRPKEIRLLFWTIRFRATTVVRWAWLIWLDTRELSPTIG